MIDPRPMELRDWADAMVLSLPGNPPRLDDDNWRGWGAALSLQPTVSVPNPYEFDGWKDWAVRLVSVNP